MKAIVYDKAGMPASDPASLFETDLPIPVPGDHDVLVRIAAIAVNPVDAKLRAAVQPPAPRVLGWDGVGTVDSTGPAVTRFRKGDVVWFAGDITRPGTYAEYTLVDERIASLAPRSIAAPEAAALPLTAITAWELLFDRLRIPEHGGEGQSVLVIGAGGGVGSILVQLAAKRTKVKVFGTASRPETQQWVRDLGAHGVIDHTQPLQPQLAALGHPMVDHVISLTHTEEYYTQIVELLKPQGQLALIDDPATLDALPLKRKSISLHWEFMFTRSMYRTDDMARQHDLLATVATLIDAGVLKTTLGEDLGTINAANLRRAHSLLETHRARGKLVLSGF